MQIQCPNCHEWSEGDAGVCTFCGASLEGNDNGHGKNKTENHKKFYRSKWFGWACAALVCMIAMIIWAILHPQETNNKKIYIQKQKEMIEKFEIVPWWRNGYEASVQSVNPDCLWYFENIPIKLSRFEYIVEDTLIKAMINKHLYDKCTRGANDNVFKSWHLGENDKHEQICYTYSLHPPKETAEYEPGLFKLSINLNSCDISIESLSSFTPGFYPLMGEHLFSYFFTYDQETNIDSFVADNLFKKDFKFYSYKFKKGKYLRIMIPVWRTDYIQEEDMFFYAYRVFPLEGMEICGQICKLK
ncbi:MAG: hypothetical protein J6A01_09585 [Proteobacteria bacterium]|nr:hypothetical protein [Pseudomonadota bacterium]